MATLKSINPLTQEIQATKVTLDDTGLIQTIQQAHRTYLAWRETSFDERKELFLKLADCIDAKNEELARLETIEMWRIFSVAKKWLRKTADLIRWYANNAEKYLASREFAHDGLTGAIQYDPLGVIYGIAPWNFPFNQVLRAAVANIIAGNTTVYKHASNVPLCAQAIHDCFLEAWFPEGVYTNIYIQASQSEMVLSHDAIAWVNITWSEWAWSAIWSLAWKYLKPSVLELWWNDAFILADHDDTDAMAAKAVACRISNGWQRCNASKRFIVLDKHYDAFVEALTKHMESEIVWDPMDSQTTIPPLAKKSLVEEVDRQVSETIEQWARCLTGWKKLSVDWFPKGNFYAPTVLVDVTPAMTAYKEEIFWPVASVIKSSSIQESIALANNSEFWLSAVVFWDDEEQCKHIASKLEWWMIFINNPAWSQASLPFGWVKKSGYGKENWSDGLRAFTNKKAIVYTVE